MIAYLDTNTVLYLAEGNSKRLTKRARQAIERFELLISPMVMLELHYLYEVKRIVATGDAILGELYQSIDLRICTLPFDKIIQTAAKEFWTRDVFDRLIVSHAKANGEAPLVSSDEQIAAHYPNTIW